MLKVPNIKFRCFKCNAKLEMPEEYIGRKGRCPNCKAKNTIPSPDDTLEDSIMMMFKDIDDAEDEQFESEYEQQDGDSYKDDDGGNLPNG
jgi:phage FluMu protein Com